MKTLTPFEIMVAQSNVINEGLKKAILARPTELSHEQKTLRFYAHDYRDMEMDEETLSGMLEQFAEALNCKHECSSDCRRSGCNCNCGEYHF
jgi:hypothetical protein